MSKADPRYNTQRWKRLRAQVIARDGRRCVVRGCQTDMTRPRMTQVDHVVEVSDGGSFWAPSNLQVVCQPHHLSKTLAVKAERAEPISPNA